MDFYTNSRFQVQKLRGLGSRDPISNFFGPPYYLRTMDTTHNMQDVKKIWSDSSYVPGPMYVLIHIIPCHRCFVS